MKIFITGGTGFLGKPTVGMLKKKGHQIMLLSRSARRVSGIKVMKGDLKDILKWKKQLKAFKPDVVLHLSWEGIPDFNAAICTKNLIVSLELFNICADIGCKKIVVSGTCFEYGQVIGKLKEDRAIAPHNAFTASKHAVHLMGDQIAKENKMQFIWTRPFYLYGQGQRAGSLIPYIIQCAKNDETPILKNPFARNDFIHVEDVAAALVRLVEQPIKDINETYNVGSGKLTSVAEVVKSVYSFLGKSIPKLGKLQKVDGFWADITKIRKDTGWKPNIDIRQGIKKTLQYNNENNR